MLSRNDHKLCRNRNLLTPVREGVCVFIVSCQDLGRMYTLFRRVNTGLQTLKDLMSDHLKETGKQLVLDPER